MFLAGDEFGNTQYGNNNAYCQDNEISWLDWNRLEQYRNLHAFTAAMTAFRREHPVLRGNAGSAPWGLAGNFLSSRGGLEPSDRKLYPADRDPVRGAEGERGG